MEFLRRAYNDTKLRFQVTKMLSAASAQSGHISMECIQFAKQHPDLVIGALCDNLNSAHAKESYLYLLLLEKLVDSCSYSFHVAMARDYVLHEKLVSLAVMRVDDSAQRQVRRLSRLAILEYSRMFADDEDLRSLSLLAQAVEKQTGRSLMRSIQLEGRKVSFMDPRPEDIVLISPVRQTVCALPQHPPRIAWSCHVCTFVNRNASNRCYACRTPRPTRPASPPPLSPEIVSAGEVKIATGVVKGDAAPGGGDAPSRGGSAGAQQKESAIQVGVIISKPASGPKSEIVCESAPDRNGEIVSGTVSGQNSEVVSEPSASPCGEIVSEAAPDRNGEIVSETAPDRNGEIVSETAPNRNGEIVSEAAPDRNGEIVSEAGPDKKGEIVSETAPERNGEIVSETAPHKNGEIVSETAPDRNGEIVFEPALAQALK